MTDNIYTRAWDERHGKILTTILESFKRENIRCFIIRNYEGLPNSNTSKDVDIIVEPKKIVVAYGILKNVYKDNNLVYFDCATFENAYQCRGMNIEDKMAIHIDLMEGYTSRGAEVISFDDLYDQTIQYKDFLVLNEYYTGVMLFIYKQFGYKKPKLKEEYRKIIYETYKKFPEFKNLLLELIGPELTTKICYTIDKQDFDKLLTYAPELTKKLTSYAFKKNFLKFSINRFKFYMQKFTKIILNYHKYAQVFSVMAPDGAGKTTFLDSLIERINFYYVKDENDEKCTIYHFRPNLLPNLGAVVEKTGIKEQDKDFTNPHRAKPAGMLSSLVRITYYWMDYVLGYNYFVRKDVQYDKFSVFDRYSYDLIVDPFRTRLNLPLWVRKLYVKCMPHPKVVFYLEADPEVIYKRKQELTLDEITRQNIIYKDVALSNKRFVILDANRPSDESVDEALKIILDNFTEKL